MKAYPFGKKVVEVADLLIQKAWDNDQGGFYTRLTESLAPAGEEKNVLTQVDCLMALNVAHRLTGAKRFQQKLAETAKVVEEKCFDPENSGVYSCFTKDWTPTSKDKICRPNLMVGGILSMMEPVASGMHVAGQPFRIWIDPPLQEITGNRPAVFTVTVQNLGFEKAKVRVGGMTAPSRWMEPGNRILDLSPHEVTSYKLTITPPDGMPEGDYCFEIACLPEGAVGEYVSVGGRVILR
jgi:hypothetical protein